MLFSEASNCLFILRLLLRLPVRPSCDLHLRSRRTVSKEALWCHVIQY